MPQASYVQGARRDKTRSHGIERVEYEDGGNRYTNSTAAWREFIDSFEDDDVLEPVDFVISGDLLRRVEAAASDRGMDVGDLIADTLASGFVAGRGAR